ncbi:unnamed protein product [Rotaria sp. Silwood2]|nr:unnamed protein product [Rotaria sp. Silwood2]
MFNYRVVKLFKNKTNPITIAGINGVSGNTLNTSTIGLSYGLFVDSNENLFVSDTNNNRVVRYSSNSSSGMPGLVVAGNGTEGSSASQLSSPYGVYVNAVGTLYVADSGNSRIQRWNKGASFGVTVAGTEVSGNSLSQLSYPMGIVVDSNEYMYIVDTGNNRILRWPPNSTSGECIVACTGLSGTALDKLTMPFALAFDSYGSLFVSDQINSRVQKFQILDGFSTTSTTMSTSTTTTMTMTMTMTMTITTATTTTAMTMTTTTTTTTMAMTITTATTTTDRTTSSEASSKTSRTRSTTVLMLIAVLVMFFLSKTFSNNCNNLSYYFLACIH